MTGEGMTDGLQFAKIDDIVVHYRVDGPAGGPKLVFSNSLGTDFRTWDAVTARLSGRYRILRYDTRGHGLTACPEGAYAIERLGDDLAGVMDAAGFDRATICGLSVGGVTAQQLHKAHPGKVRALILCDTAAKIGDDAMWQARIDNALGPSRASPAWPRPSCSAGSPPASRRRTRSPSPAGAPCWCTRRPPAMPGSPTRSRTATCAATARKSTFPRWWSAAPRTVRPRRR